MWCIGWIDSFPEPNGGHGLTWFRNQPAVDGAFSRKPCCWRWRRRLGRRRRNIYGFWWSGCRLRKWHSMRRGTENTSPDRRKADDVREPDTVPVPHLHRLTHPHYSHPQKSKPDYQNHPPQVWEGDCAIKSILRKLPLTVQTGHCSKPRTFLPSIAVRHRYGPFQSSNPFFSIAVNKGRNRS